jgi:hypothetical protein
LPDGNLREDAVHKIGRGIGHPSSHAGRTEPSPLAGERNDLVMAAAGTSHAGEAVCKDAAVEIPLEFLPDLGGQPFAAAAKGGELQEGRPTLHFVTSCFDS